MNIRGKRRMCYVTLENDISVYYYIKQAASIYPTMQTQQE